MTDTDRDLLERAAMAVGIKLDFTIRGDFPPYYVNERGGHSSWCPLDDDGEALRLAVKLGISVSFYNSTGLDVPYPSIIEVGAFAGWSPTYFEANADDWPAATRRAIVRAAAALGDAK